VHSVSANRSRVDSSQIIIKIKFNEEAPVNLKPIIYEPMFNFVKAIQESWNKWEQFDLEEDMADL